MLNVKFPIIKHFVLKYIIIKGGKIMGKKEKAFLITSLTLNILIILAVISSFIYSFFLTGEMALTAKGLNSLRFYTVISNLLLAILTIPLIVNEIISLKNNILKIPAYASGLRFLGVTGTTITILTVACFISPMEVSNGGSYLTMFQGPNFIYHFVVPVLAIISFCVFEANQKLKFKNTPYGLISVLAYMIFYILNVKFHYITSGIDGVYDWYGFLGKDGNRSIWLVALLMLLASYLVCILLWALKLAFGHLFFAKEPMPIAEETSTPEIQPNNSEDTETKQNIESRDVSEENKEEQHAEENNESSEDEVDVEILENEEKSQKSPTKTPSNKTNTYNGKTRTYHISKVEGKGWQVKLATGKKAIKFFPTQKEAIAYAKSLSVSQGGSVRIHSVKGKMRK